MSDQAVIPTSRRVNRIVIGAAIALVVAAAIGIWLGVSFVNSERQRDLQAWQVRMGIVADGRTAAVQAWLDQKFDVMQGLAENQSLQLYMTELALGITDAASEAAEFTYLRNLLTVTAERTGFTTTDDPSSVPANVERTGLAGIALTNELGTTVATSIGMPQLTPDMRQAIAAAISGEAAIFDMALGPTGTPVIGFAVPIYAVQDDTGGAEAIGAVFGLRQVGDELFGLLPQPGDTLQTSETYLVRADGAVISYLSPLRDGTEALRRSLDQTTPDLAAAFVVDAPGGFGARRNYDGAEVLVTGRALVRAPWHLVRIVESSEALTEIETRSSTLLTVFVLIVVLVVAALIAVWRHATSLREAEAAERYRVAAELFTNVTEFLRAVTDNMPDPIFAVDREGKYTFANMTAATEAELHPREMIGKLMSGVIGPVKARTFRELNAQAISSQQAVSQVHHWSDDGDRQVVRSNHLPLPETKLRPEGALVLLADLTDVSAERDRRERTLHQLVRTLMAVVDRRDPYSANHSARVAEVGVAIAVEMDLPEVSRDTVEIAGSLINLGKTFVRRELLTKTDDLSDEEREILRRSVQHSADLLERVEFDGPVVDTIRQMQEHWDGSGPRGMAGEDIEIAARIVAVANAFVGMVSARAYRDAMSVNRACAILQENAGSQFDRRPVSALINYLDNRGGRDKWSHYGERPEVGGDGREE